MLDSAAFDRFATTLLTISLLIFICIIVSLKVRQVRNNGWRWSIAEMLGAMLFVAIVLVPITLHLERARQVERARDAIERIGGELVEIGSPCRYEIYLRRPQIGDMELMGIKPFVSQLSVVEIIGVGSGITEDGAAAFRRDLPQCNVHLTETWIIVERVGH